MDSYEVVRQAVEGVAEVLISSRRVAQIHSG